MMISAFQSRVFGLGLGRSLTDAELAIVNSNRKDEHYFSGAAAMEVYQKLEKSPLQKGDAVVKKYTLKNNDKNYSLRHLMSKCEDFQAEQSAMEFLADEISRVQS